MAKPAELPLLETQIPMNSATQRILFVTALVAIGALTRLLPHAPNFTAIGALAIYGGWALRKPAEALGVTLGVMLLTDVFLGIYPGMEWTYVGLAALVVIGKLLPVKQNWMGFGLAGLSGSVVFFLVSNVGAWLTLDFYTKDLAGLMLCYTAALPFFGNFLFSTFLFGAIAFGAHGLASKRFPAIQH